MLLAQRNNRTANRLLAALMVSFTIYLASDVYYAAGVVRAYPQFFGLSFPMLWLFGPLTYLYTIAASDRSWRLGGRHLWHFALPAAAAAIAVPYLLMSGAAKLAFYDRLIAGDVPTAIAVIDPTKFISGIGYSVATVTYLRRHRRLIEDNYSNVARVNLRWLLWLAGTAAAIWLFATGLALTDVADRVREEQVTLAIAVTVYAIGYMGLRQPEVFRYQTAEFAIPAAPSRYERSGLSDDEGRGLEEALRRIMDAEQPWKDSELTLPELAARVNSTPHKLSEMLNSRVGQTFYDFVNGYRVREVQRRITAGDAKTLKMLALAMDAGFASKSTFNEVFRKHTGQTPSDFRQSVGA